jgi:hypothetical protein
MTRISARKWLPVLIAGCAGIALGALLFSRPQGGGGNQGPPSASAIARTQDQFSARKTSALSVISAGNGSPELVVEVQGPDGAPARGIWIGLEPAPTTHSRAYVTGADGRLSIAGLPSGEFTLVPQYTLSAERETWIRPNNVTLAPTGQHVLFRYAQGFQLQGRVLTNGNTPAIGAWVHAYEGDVHYAGEQTDSDGHFRMIVEGPQTRSVQLRAMLQSGGKTLFGQHDLSNLAAGAITLHIK